MSECSQNNIIKMRVLILECPKYDIIKMSSFTFLNAIYMIFAK